MHYLLHLESEKIFKHFYLFLKLGGIRQHVNDFSNAIRSRATLLFSTSRHMRNENKRPFEKIIFVYDTS